MSFNEVNEKIEQIAPDLIGYRRYFHENPELSGKEFLCSRFIYEKLKEAGIEARIHESGCGIVATIQGRAGKNILYRADMDALPISEESGLDFSSSIAGTMHACGHDIHMTVLLGTALTLNKYKEKITGSVKFVFQGGEENFTGAKTMIDDGVLENPKPDYALALHTWPALPSGVIGLKKGAMMASSSSVNIKIKGRGGHAAHPHMTIDPVIVAAYILTSLQTIESRNVAPLNSSVITFGRLIAGTASNIIPDEAEAQGTVRALSANTDKFIEERIKTLVKFQAESFGATAETLYKQVCPPVINDAELIDKLANSGQTSIGMDQVVWLDEPSMGSEDFALYLEEVPGALVRLGSANNLPQSKLPLHNSKIIFDEGCIKTGVIFMTSAILKILDPNFH